MVHPYSHFDEGALRPHLLRAVDSINASAAWRRVLVGRHWRRSCAGAARRGAAAACRMGPMSDLEIGLPAPVPELGGGASPLPPPALPELRCGLPRRLPSRQPVGVHAAA